MLLYWFICDGRTDDGDDVGVDGDHHRGDVVGDGDHNCGDVVCAGHHSSRPLYGKFPQR